MICDRGDVVVVPFPFVDIAADKRRPSLVLSRRAFNRSHGHSICAMITTFGHTRWPSDIVIDNLATAGLSRPCVIRWKLFTLPNDIIAKRAGRLADPKLNQLAAAASTILA